MLPLAANLPTAHRLQEALRPREHGSNDGKVLGVRSPSLSHFSHGLPGGLLGRVVGNGRIQAGGEQAKRSSEKVPCRATVNEQA